MKSIPVNSAEILIPDLKKNFEILKVIRKKTAIDFVSSEN